MGWFDGRSSSSSSHRRRSPSRRSTYSTHHARGSAPSILSFGGGSRVGGSRVGGSRVGGRSSPSVFSSTSSSSRRARPRAGFVQRIVSYIKRLFRDIYDYARRHPVKVFMLVIVPLITSGVLVKLLGMIGIRLPKSIFGNLARPGIASQGGMKEGLNGIMNIAKMFI